MTLSHSTQILILAIVPLLFISVNILCKFAMLPAMYILLSPQEGALLPEGKDVHIRQHIHKKD